MRPGGCSLTDVVDEVTHQDVCLVFPTFGHTLYYWPKLRERLRERWGEDVISATNTAIINKVTHRVLRMWIPYYNSAEQPMQVPRNRQGFYLMSPWYLTWELRRWQQ